MNTVKSNLGLLWTFSFTMFRPLNSMQQLQNKLHSCLLTAVTDTPSLLLQWMFSFFAFAWEKPFISKWIFSYFFLTFFHEDSIIYYKMDHLAQWAAAHMGPMGRWYNRTFRMPCPCPSRTKKQIARYLHISKELTLNSNFYDMFALPKIVVLIQKLLHMLCYTKCITHSSE